MILDEQILLIVVIVVAIMEGSTKQERSLQKVDENNNRERAVI